MRINGWSTHVKAKQARSDEQVGDSTQKLMSLYHGDSANTLDTVGHVHYRQLINA
jgi:hypothetical protein